MIGLIEDALLDVLKASAEVLGYKYRTLETYPADWDVYLKDKTLTYPAAWVTFGAADPDGQTRQSTRLKGSFGLIVAAQNVRNERAQRHGQTVANGKNEVGSYQMAVDAIRLLGGSTIGLDEISPLQVGQVRFVRPTAAILSAKVSMIAVQFMTTFPIDFGLAAGPLDDFKTLDASWDVPPFRAPDEDGEDLHSTISLPFEEEP